MIVREAIERTYRRYLYAGGANEPAFDTLAAGIDDNDLTLTTNGLQDYIPQGIIEIGSEAIYTRESETSTAVDLATRGYRGTTAAAHAIGDIILIQPEWLRDDVLDAISEVIGSLFSLGLYRIVSTTALTPSTTGPVELPAGAKDVLSIVVRPNASSNWVPLRPGKDYEVLRVTDPPLLQMRTAHGWAMTLNYSTDFTKPTSEADDLTTVCGVPDTLVPHIPMAVAAILLRGRELPKVMIEEIRRQLGQGVQSGTYITISEALEQKFEEYVTQERVRQFDRTPVRFEYVR